MTIDPAPLSQRVASYYNQLSSAAKDLNAISDELGKSIAEIDVALKKLNLGVAVWVPIRHDEGTPNESWYWSEDIGYAKFGTTWGICLRKVNGDFQRGDDDEQVESWLFTDAPRTLRISAIEKIPGLLEKLSKEAVKTTNDIRARLSEAQAVAEAVKGAANGSRVPLRIPPSASKDSVTLAKSTQGVAVPSSGDPTLDSIRHAVGSALVAAGHSSAAQLLGAGKWMLDGASLRVEVPGVGKKMLSLTVNAAAEKIIRQELQRLGGPSRFMLVPDATTAKTSASTSEASPLPNAVAEVQK
jgi:hypothetical protein